MQQIRLTYIGGSSGHDGCPALYDIDGLPAEVADGKEWAVVQGKRYFDEQIRGQLVGLRDNEDYVLVPKDMIRDHLDMFTGADQNGQKGDG